MRKQELHQGDVLRVTLTDAGNNKYIATPAEGWLLVTEVNVDGGVLQANFAHLGHSGYGGVVHPKYKQEYLIRGKHGECSPYAALKKMGLETLDVKKTPEIKEGTYMIDFKNDRYEVKVMKTLQGQWPCAKEVLMAHFASGFPRFPWPVKEMQELGINFYPIKK